MHETVNHKTYDDELILRITETDFAVAHINVNESVSVYIL